MSLPHLDSAAALALYDLESYLFNDVAGRFHSTPTGEGVTAFDFFCIVIWKSNRSKSYTAKRMMARANADLETAVTTLIAQLRQAATGKERLRVLFDEWSFSLPMASAILTVFYPDEFTVYDRRVCQLLLQYASLGNRSKFEKVWPEYKAFVDQ